MVASIDGLEVNCEMTGKAEGTEPKRSTLRQTLKNKRNQLPKGRPNIVFVRIPETWMNTDQAKEEVSQAIEGHFRDSSRMTAVVIHWEEWTQFADGRLLQVIHFRQYPNERAPQHLSWLQPAIESWISGKRANWFSLHRAVCTDEEFKNMRSESYILELVKMSMNGANFHFSKDGFPFA